MNLRNTALAACISAVLAVSLAMGNAARTILATGRWWTLPLFAFTVLVSTIMPVFFFALYRNEGDLRFSQSLRHLSLITALAFGAMVLVQFPAFFESTGRIGHRSVLTSEPSHFSQIDVSWMAGWLSNCTYILLLLVFFRQKDDGTETPVPVSKVLRVTATTAAIALGLGVAFNVLRIVVSPYIYSQARTYTQQTGRVLPPFRALLQPMLKDLLTNFCLFIAPFVIWNAIRDARRTPQGLQGDASDPLPAQPDQASR